MLAILTTHPIQYQVPLWKALAKDGRVPFEVWYLSDHGTKPTYDIQFGKTFGWDIDTLSGYPHRFLRVNKKADVSRFVGLTIEESLGVLFEQRNVHVLWVQGWQVMAYWQAVWAAHRHEIPVWLRAETNDLHRSHWLKQLPRHFALSQLFHRISRFLFIGSANRRLYKRFGVSDSKLVPAPYFVDNERFMRVASELAPTRTSLRQQWNIPEEATCFLFCGKFIEKKHPLDLLAASRILFENGVVSQQLPKLHLLMVGEGELRPILEEKARELESVAGYPVVTFTGFLNQTEIPKAYVAADCLVLPSDAGETWGLVVNEALACGLPAIVSNLCGCAEDLVKPFGNDAVYRCGELAELSDRMYKKLAQTPSVFEKQTLDDILQKHSTSSTLSTVVHLYRSKTE